MTMHGLTSVLEMVRIGLAVWSCGSSVWWWSCGGGVWWWCEVVVCGGGVWWWCVVVVCGGGVWCVVRCVGQPIIIFGWLAPKRHPENPEIAEFWILGRRSLGRLAGSEKAPRKFRNR